MTLNGTVVQIESGSQHADRLPRAFILVRGAKSGWDKIAVCNADDLKLDDKVQIEITVTKIAAVA